MRAFCILGLLTTTLIQACGERNASQLKDSVRYQHSQIYEMGPNDPRPGYSFTGQLTTAGYDNGHYQGPRADGCVVQGPRFNIRSSQGHGQVTVDIYARAWVYSYYTRCEYERGHASRCQDTMFLRGDHGAFTVEFLANGRSYASKEISWFSDRERETISLDPFTWDGNLMDFEIRVCTKAKPSEFRRDRMDTSKLIYEGEIHVFKTSFNADWNDAP